MATPASKSSYFSFTTLCLRRAATDSIRFLKLSDLASWIKLFAPPLLTFAILWYLLGPESATKQIPTWLAAVLASIGLALVVFLVHLVVAPHRILIDSTERVFLLESEVQKLQQAQIPRLAIVFQSSDTFVHGRSPNFLYRVSIQNLSTTMSLESVVVDLTNIKPYRPPNLPMRLHLMHDNPADGVHQQSFDLAPGENRFVDLVEIHHNKDGVFFAIKHIVRNIGPYIADKVEGLTVVARAKNCPSVTAEFQITKQDREYRFSMLP
jgi:hypothetical protein